MPMVMMLVVFMSAFIVYTYKRDMLEYQCEQIDANLTYSLLASAVVNLTEYAQSGNLVIADGGEPACADRAFLEAYLSFVDCLKCNMSLGENMENLNSVGLCGDVKIVFYKIYNYIADEDGFHVVECGISGGQAYTVRYADDKPVRVRANGGTVEICETSVCAEITFNIDGIGEYSLTRLVAVTDKNKEGGER